MIFEEKDISSQIDRCKIDPTKLKNEHLPTFSQFGNLAKDYKS